MKALAKRPEDRATDRWSSSPRIFAGTMEGLPVERGRRHAAVCGAQVRAAPPIGVGAAALILLTLVGGTGRHAVAGARRRTRAGARRAAVLRRRETRELSFLPALRFGSAAAGIAAGAGRHGGAVAAISRSAGGREKQRSSAAAGIGRRLCAARYDPRSARSAREIAWATPAQAHRERIAKPCDSGTAQSRVAGDDVVESDLARANLLLGPRSEFSSQPKEAVVDSAGIDGDFRSAGASEPRIPKNSSMPASPTWRCPMSSAVREEAFSKRRSRNR